MTFCEIPNDKTVNLQTSDETKTNNASHSSAKRQSEIHHYIGSKNAQSQKY